MPSDLFKLKHSEFLDEIEAVWARYRADSNELRIYLQTKSRLPPNWLRGRLTLSACDAAGRELQELEVTWVDIFGSPIGGMCPCPQAFKPGSETPFSVNIGDFVLRAGGCERTRPNLSPANEPDKRDDVRWRIS